MRILRVVLLLALAACAPAAGRAPGTTAPIPSTWTQDEQEIRAALASSAAGWNEANLTKHLALYDSSVTFMTRNGPRAGVEPIRQAFSAKYFVNGRPKQALSFDHVTVQPLGRDAAMVTGRFLLSGGSEADQSGWFTLVWVRTPNGWRVVRDHTS